MRCPSRIGVILIVAGLSWSASAQDYPQQTIRMVVPFGPGGGADIIGRILADAMQEKLGKPVIVENKPGAGGIIGNDIVAKAAPDGYTIGIMTAGQIIAATTRKSMPYDTTTAFAPITQVATASLLIATRPDFPANNVKELIALAKSNPGKLIFASPGFAATQHFAGEMFKQMAGIDLLHVPFKTTPEAINAVLGKQADVIFDTVSALIGQIEGGQLKALAVTGKKRSPALPDVPTVAEQGYPNFEAVAFIGMMAPAATPRSVVEKINADLEKILAMPEIKDKLAAQGFTAEWMKPADFGSYLAKEVPKWGAIVKCAKVTID